MPVDKTKILISPEEEQAIKDNSPDQIPLDATAQGWSGSQIRAQMAASITGNEGSLLSELKEKTALIKDKFDEVDVAQASADVLIAGKAEKTYVDAQDATKADKTYVENVEAEKLDIDGSNAASNIAIKGVTFNAGNVTDAVQDQDFLDFPNFNGNTGMQAYDTHIKGLLSAKLEAEDVSAFAEKIYVDTKLADKSNIGHSHFESDIINLDKYSKSETDALLSVKTDIGHAHMESDITDLDKYSQSAADAKFMGKEDYVDSNDKFLFSKFPDVAKQQTYVVSTLADLPTVDILAGSKAFITSGSSAGDSYIYNGTSWILMADADWQNVSLEWANIVNPPTANGGISLAGSSIYNKTQADTLLAGKSNTGHVHVESEITNLDKYTQAQVDAIAALKSNVGHQHQESDIVNLDKYTQAQVNTLLTGKSDTTHVHTETDITNLDKYTKNEVDTKLLTKSNTGHVHVESDITNLDKYTQAQTDTLLAGKSNTGHTHLESEITDLDKYTQLEVDTKLATKSNTGHTHVEANITDLDKYTQAEVNAIAAGKANSVHTHVEADITDLDKYTKAEANALLANKVNLTGDNSQIKADKIGVTDATGVFVGTNVETVLKELFDTKVSTSKLGGTTEGNIPLLDAEGLIAPQYLGDRYSDVFKGYGVFDMTNPQVPVLLEIYAASQWDELGNAPIVDAVAYPKRANAIYVTVNVTVNTMYRYSETTLEFAGLAPSPLGLGNTSGTAYPGNEGQANRDAISGMILGTTVVAKATKDASDNVITTTYALKTTTDNHINNTSNPHGVTVGQIGAEPAFTKNTGFNKNLGNVAGTVAEGNHLHSGIYEPVFAKNTAFNKNFGTGTGTVSEGNHAHAGVYEPVFTKNTAFNKNLGTTSGTVAEGNHNHDAAYEPKNTNIQTHISSSTNPHGVTATQIGLGSVLNYGVATQLEAQAGTASNKYMTPLRTAEAIASINPKVHTHVKADITDFAHTHVKADITDFAHTHVKADITDFAHTHVKADITDFAHDHTFASLTSKPTTIAGYGITDAYTKTETNTQISTAIAGIVGSTPETLNTLDELAAALGDDPNFATSMTTLIGTKVTSNAAITGATKTKITYDSKGLVTGGTDAAIADITGLSAALAGKSDTGHAHTGVYEPAFTKNTGFNKNFGTTAGTVAQGNDARFSDARNPLEHTHLYAGSATAGGPATSLANFITTTTTSIGIDGNLSGIGYITNTLLGSSDGAMYTQVYSATWKHQIQGDYRTGQIAVRGKNSGTWQAWRTVLDSSNYTDYAPTKTGTGASGTWGIAITGNAATATKLATTRAITVGSTAKNFDGSAPISFTLNEIGIKNYAVSIPNTSWTGSVAPFTKAVTVTGITATHIPIIDIDLSSVTYENTADMITAWSKIYRAVTSANTITFYADEVPSVSIPINIKVVN